MSEVLVIDVGRKALLTMLQMGGPMLLAALVIGLTISLIQSATQLNEMTMTFIPKVLGVGAVLLFMMPSMAHQFELFFNELMALIPQILP